MGFVMCPLVPDVHPLPSFSHPCRSVLTPCPPLPPGEGVRRSCGVSPRPKGEGIKGVRTDAERETEIRSERDRASQVYTPLVGLVGPRRARLAVAPNPRSVPRARLRVHAAADASEPRGGVLSALSRAVSQSGSAGPGSSPRGQAAFGCLREPYPPP